MKPFLYHGMQIRITNNEFYKHDPEKKGLDPEKSNEGKGPE